MQISTYSRYGLRAIIRLAIISNNNEKELVSIKEIAAIENISVKYLEAIFTTLKKGKILQSVKGKSGGYRLAKKPDDISVFDILEILDGEITLLCCIDNKDECVNSITNCTVYGFWKTLDTAIKDILKNKTLQNFIDEQQKEKLNYII